MIAEVFETALVSAVVVVVLCAWLSDDWRE